MALVAVVSVIFAASLGTAAGGAATDGGGEIHCWPEENCANCSGSVPEGTTNVTQWVNANTQCFDLVASQVTSRWNDVTGGVPW